tara:strand:- start:498 stop:1115 length:618 start_codon:yes stop_codon:yes gene_type:complete
MSRFEATTQLLVAENALKIRLSYGSVDLRYDEVIGLWHTDDEFCLWFSDTLAGAGFEAFFFETPPVDLTSRSQAFECVVLDAPSLVGAPPDPFSFHELFPTEMNKQVVVFDNLVGDARLIAPCPMGTDDRYSHLANFVRKAPREQRAQIWREVGDCMSSALGTAPIWLNTSGLGVKWLHVRLDSRPKYYLFTPYRQATRGLRIYE